MQPRLSAPANEPPRALAPPRPWHPPTDLDVASQMYLDELMHGEAAQTAFRDRNEEGYVDHVNQGLLNHPTLARFALPQGLGSPGPAPAPGAEAARQERERVINEATLRYAGLIAMRRASHGDALLEQQQRRGRAGRVAARVVGTILNPAETGDYKKAEQLAHRSAEAADEYRRQIDQYIASEPRTHDQAITARYELMDRFEAAVQSEALLQTRPRQAQDGRRYRNRWDTWQARQAEAWFNGGKVRRAAIVAPWALGAGAVAGIAVGAASLPAVGVGAALFGTVLAGRSIGGAIASSVNRFQAAHRPTLELHGQQALARNRAHANYLRTHLTPTEQQLDITRVYESATLARAQENLHRKRRAELVGAVAAGAAFGVTAWGVSNLESAVNQGAHPAATHGATSTPTHQPPTPNTTPTPTTPAVNVHDAPWNVAHQLRPGHEWDLINSAMQKYNAAHGTHLHLVEHANGTQWTWIEDGTRALNPSSQAVFNQFMDSLAHAA